PHPEQGTAPVWASPASPVPSASHVSKPPPSAASKSAPGPSAPSNPSSTTSLIGSRRRKAPRRRPRSFTPTSVAAILSLGDANVLKHPPLDQLHALGLYGMAKAFADITAADQAKDLPHADWLALLLDRETSWRGGKRPPPRPARARV